MITAWILACDPPAPPPPPPPPTPDRPADPPAAPPTVRFDGRQGPVPPAVRTSMEGVSWRPGCPVPIDDLALLDLPYWGPAGVVERGELVIAESEAVGVLSAFAVLFDARFPITRMERVDAYGADDRRSMAADNTSAFNCRPVAGGTRWSEHAFGLAIDLNPLQNPFVKGDRVSPPGGRAFLDRATLPPGGIGPDGVVVRAFRAIGWGWGGDWTTSKDYQHVSRSGR